MRGPPPPTCSARGGKDASAPWENPRTGARGTVTPIASAYTQDGQTCRDFLASYVSGSFAVLDAGRSLQAEQGRLGSPRAQALEAVLTDRAFHRLRCIRAV